MSTNKQLNKTLKIGNDTYDINAVNADIAGELCSVFLKLNKHFAKNTSQTVGGVTTTQREIIDSGEVGLNGKIDKEHPLQTISYVDANQGGHFNNPISVAAHDTNYDIDDKDILNYGELKTYFTKDLYKNLQNLSVGHTWDGTKLTVKDSTITGSTRIEGINVVYGTGDHTSAAAFAQYNRNAANAAKNKSGPYLPYLSSFFYITTNKKISGELENSDCPYYAEAIYFGTQDSSDIIRLRTDFAKQADKATQADKLAVGRTIQVNLQKTSTDTFDGSEDYVGTVSGILPTNHGGTGNNLGKARGLTHNVAFSVTLDNKDTSDSEITKSSLYNNIEGTTLSLDIPVHGVLPEKYGGTGDSEGHHPKDANGNAVAGVTGGPKIYAAENIIVQYGTWADRAVPIIISATQPDGNTHLPQGTIWIQV